MGIIDWLAITKTKKTKLIFKNQALNILPDRYWEHVGEHNENLEDILGSE
jgi:hypothetical protein